MKHIGIDYGTKRIGIATSDEGGSLAFPHSVVAAGKSAADTVAAIVAKEGVQAIVVGESHDLLGKPNPIMAQVRRFAGALRERTGIEPEYMTEVYTSREATHIQGDNDQNDASAAAIMLQSYLDRRAHRGGGVL